MTRIRALAFTAAGLQLLSACKDFEPGQAGDERPAPSRLETPDGEVVDAGHLRPAEGYFATDPAYLQKNANVYFKLWDDSFSRRLDSLPVSAAVPDDKMGFSGAYYAEDKGGINVVVSGSRSPVAKWDAAFHGGQSLATSWEADRDKHSGTGISWAGHCNGWAAAVQRHPKEPARSVVRNGVTFAPEDIKALLAEIYMSADFEFLGGNRCEQVDNAGSPLDRPDKTVMGACEDINPGTFHAALANWIGRKGHTLIMDVSRDKQIWNHPIVSYQVLTKENVSAAQARQYVVGDGGGTYVFNPLAVRFVYVRTKVNYLSPTSSEVLGRRHLVDPPMDLTYILELDGAGDIVGGEWTTQSRQSHPDFLWVAYAPLAPNGTEYMGNPHVDSAEVIKLWAESAGFDPNQPPTDILRPSGANDWGRFPDFDVTLDGNDRGAAFAGKQVRLVIKRKDTLKGAGMALESRLDGADLPAVQAVGDEDMVVAFNPKPGLHRFELIFKRGGVAVHPEPQSVRFKTVW